MRIFFSQTIYCCIFTKQIKKEFKKQTNLVKNNSKTFEKKVLPFFRYLAWLLKKEIAPSLEISAEKFIHKQKSCEFFRKIRIFQNFSKHLAQKRMKSGLGKPKYGKLQRNILFGYDRVWGMKRHLLCPKFLCLTKFFMFFCFPPFYRFLKKFHFFSKFSFF